MLKSFKNLAPDTTYSEFKIKLKKNKDNKGCWNFG